MCGQQLSSSLLGQDMDMTTIHTRLVFRLETKKKRKKKRKEKRNL
jgi:hypothetical protein